MNQIRLYVEGGGDSKELDVRCREGFRKLLSQTGFNERMPRIVACGRRQAAFDSFVVALSLQSSQSTPMLLVDSETPVTSAPWQHLRSRDHWLRPHNATDDQAQLMVTSMETWVLADRAALRAAYGSSLNENALLPLRDLEGRTRDSAFDALDAATGGRYQKGRESYRVLGMLNPDQVAELLPHFRRFWDALNKYCLH